MSPSDRNSRDVGGGCIFRKHAPSEPQGEHLNPGPPDCSEGPPGGGGDRPSPSRTFNPLDCLLLWKIFLPCFLAQAGPALCLPHTAHRTLRPLVGRGVELDARGKAVPTI